MSGWNENAETPTRSIGDIIDSLGWIERAGMLRVAETLETGSIAPRSDE